MRLMVWLTALTTVFAQIACAQGAATNHAIIACKSLRNASDRLVCTDPDLAAVDSILTITLQDAKGAMSKIERGLLEREQRIWIRERNQKCGLTGMVDLQSARECLEDAINARIADLQDSSETNSIAAPTSAPSGQSLIITQVAQPPGSASPGASFSELPTFQELRFSAPADGIGGVINCSAPFSHLGTDPLENTPYSGKWIIKISIDDDASSYRMFENDTWTPFLNNLRNSVHTACASALKSGSLRNIANEPVSEIYDVFEVYSAQGFFMAYSIGQNSPWTLQTNLPKARKAVKSDLGIQTWINASQLTNNPYFFKGSVVGMVIQFDHMLSENEALFERPGAEIFVSGVSSSLFQSKELVVLAGRVTGNKGVISPRGSEALLPALDYIGAYKCGDTCGGF